MQRVPLLKGLCQRTLVAMAGLPQGPSLYLAAKATLPPLQSLAPQLLESPLLGRLPVCMAVTSVLWLKSPLCRLVDAGWPFFVDDFLVSK